MTAPTGHAQKQVPVCPDPDAHAVSRQEVAVMRAPLRIVLDALDVYAAHHGDVGTKVGGAAMYLRECLAAPDGT